MAESDKTDIPTATLVDENTPLASSSDAAPGSTWRVGLFSCFDVVKLPLFWQAFCCQNFLVAQLLERMHLDWIGRPTADYAKTCNIVTGIIVGYLTLQLMGYSQYIAPFMMVYIVIAMTRLRFVMRQRYGIQPNPSCNCHSHFEDCCTVFWCGCCSSIQMARQTHQDEYECFMNRGLPEGAEECV